MVDVMLRFGVVGVMALGVLQDPTTSLPDAYKVQFENDYVRVVRVHYDAGAKLPEHTHPGGTTVYVYLNDSEGVVFSHVGGSNRAVTRPAVKAGAIRIASGPEEHHTAENTSSTAERFPAHPTQNARRRQFAKAYSSSTTSIRECNHGRVQQRLAGDPAIHHRAWQVDRR